LLRNILYALVVLKALRMVASQHPLRSCLTQSPADGCFATSSSQLPYPKTCGWLLRNILFAVALPKDLRMVASQHPLCIGRTQSSADGCFATSSSQLPYPKPYKTSTVLMFCFCILVTASKQALCDSLNAKARTVRAGFVTPSGFKPETF
jgi:hypothetical protein